jgi:hypothetical protein
VSGRAARALARALFACLRTAGRDRCATNQDNSAFFACAGSDERRSGGLESTRMRHEGARRVPEAPPPSTSRAGPTTRPFTASSASTSPPSSVTPSAPTRRRSRSTWSTRSSTTSPAAMPRRVSCAAIATTAGSTCSSLSLASTAACVRPAARVGCATIAANDDVRRERLVRYCARPPLSLSACARTREPLACPVLSSGRTARR